jgi:hypothetical protein
VVVRKIEHAEVGEVVYLCICKRKILKNVKEKNSGNYIKDISEETEDILLLSHFNSLSFFNKRISSGICAS